MARNRFQPSALTAASAVSAAIAALALTACGPNDSGDSTAFAGGAAATTPAPAAPAPLVAAADRTGAPVPAAPLAAPQPAYAPPPPVQVAAAPTYGTAPYGQTGYASPQGYPAQSQPSVAANTGYAVPTTRVADRPVAEPRPVDRSHAGSVESIVPERERPQGSGAGAVIGGVLGAVVGNQFGHGSGRVAMTGAGAVGGAIAGNHIERSRNEQVTGYRVSVRLDNGSVRNFERSQVGGLQVGDRVRVDAASFRRL